MKRACVAVEHESFNNILDRVAYRGERVVVNRGSNEVAAIVSMEDLRLLERLVLEEEDRIDTAAAEAARAESEDRVSLAEFVLRCRKDEGY